MKRLAYFLLSFSVLIVVAVIAAGDYVYRERVLSLAVQKILLQKIILQKSFTQMKKIEVHLEETDGTNGLMRICLIGG